MITITDINEANSLLNKYMGGKAELFGISVGHQRLAIRLSKLDLTTNVAVIVVAQCRHIKGPFRWTNAQMSISCQVTNGERETLIHDDGADFVAIADGGFGVLYGEWNEFGMFFDSSSGNIE
ncbi:hypothetical protein [Dawidia cretensis]|nr:hypothetical protein [Dawidia cretensis]